jgi:type VI secretion system secreted protein VgrG
LIEDWTEQQVVSTGKYTLGDYGFDKALREETVSTGKSASHQFAGSGITDYHVDGDFLPDLAPAVSARSKVRIEELQSHRCRKFGRGPLAVLAVGSLFTLKRHPVSGQNVQHLVISTKVSCSVPYLRSGSQVQAFTVSFEASPSDLPFRPERATPKPALDGLHTAVVTDNDGAGCDWSKTGPMVKLKFFWGSNADGDAQSGWARVAQVAASNGFGAMFLPQVNDEVVVSFLEGDPDRPLVIGSVYHGNNKPFYPQDKQLKQSGIRTAGGNELTFDDGFESDKKKIYVEASEDMEVKVAKEEKRACETYILEAQKSITIKTGSAKIEMKNDGTINITGMNISIKGDGGDVKLDGLNVQATAQVGAKMTGSATAEISSSGQTTVKGSIVMVN